MGALQGSRGERLSLRPRTVLGRSAAGGIVVAEPSASHEHAVIWWSGEEWFLKDLGSRNGTWLGTRQLEPGVEAELRENDTIQIGREAVFAVASLTPPAAEALSLLTGESVLEEDGLLAVPSSDDPQVSLYRGPSGDWVQETDEVTEVADLALVRTRGDVFQVFLPVPSEATVRVAPAPRVDTIRLEFRHTRDEEHVDIVVCSPSGAEMTTLANRAHHYLLLLLARQRLADAEASEADRGWLYQEELVRMLRTDDPGLNLHVFRSRKALAKLGVEDAAGIVERRSGSRQLRIGVRDVVVHAV